jgi:hypothetical protein
MSTTEKAHEMRQVGTEKANVSEPLLKCRKRSNDNRNRGSGCCPGKSQGDTCLLPWRLSGTEVARARSGRRHETWEPLAVMARAGVLTLACGRENPKQLEL